MTVEIREFDELEPGSLVRAIYHTNRDTPVTAWGIKAVHNASEPSEAKGIFWLAGFTDRNHEEPVKFGFEIGFSGEVLYASRFAQIATPLSESVLFRNLDELMESGHSGPALIGSAAFVGNAFRSSGQDEGQVVCSLNGIVQIYMKGKALHDGACVLFAAPSIYTTDEESTFVLE